MNLPLRSLLVLLLVVITVQLPAAAPPPAPERDRTTVERLLAAIQQSDHAAFLADGEAAWQQLPKAQFETVSTQLAPLLTPGYELTYLGELKQRGYRVTLWRLRFASGGDDALANLSVKGDKVGGFWVR